MSIKEIYACFLNSNGVSTDTRSIAKGQIFLALKGGNFNGNKYAESAIEKGASYAIVDEPAYAKDERFILVENALYCLQALATYHRLQFNIPIIGITGSNGKTTSKELMHAVLCEKYQLVATLGNLNNHIGVPLSLLRIRESTEIAIIEMGANHLGEIADYCCWTQPNYGIITNIGKAHLEGFGSVENIMKAKGELYEWIKQSNGIIFHRKENQFLAKMLDTFQGTISYGSTTSGAKYQACLAEVESDNGIGIETEYGSIHSKLQGCYNYENLLLAYAIGNYFGLTFEQIRAGIERYQPTNNRSQLIKSELNQIILDAYNSNPSSLIEAIEDFFRKETKLEKVLLLGDMFELGKASTEEHHKILETAEVLGFKAVFLAGEAFYQHKDRYPLFTFFKETEQLAEKLKAMQLKNRFILIKGSRGMRMESLLPLVSN